MMGTRAALIGLTLVAGLASPLSLPADVIHLKNGNSIEVRSWRDTGDEIEFPRFGGVVRVPKSDVLRIDRERPEAGQPSPGGPAPGDEVFKPLVDKALGALSAGDLDRLVSYFRYLDESETAFHKEGMKRMLKVIRDRLGKPGRVEPVSAVSSTYFGLHVESAEPHQWRQSDCAFKQFAFKTSMVEGKATRPAELVLELCYGQTAKTVGLRKVDFHFLDPSDPKLLQTMAELMQTIQKLAQERGKRP